MDTLDFTPYKLGDRIDINDIKWNTLSRERSAIKLEQNPNKVYKLGLPSNPSIFKIDYQLLQERIEPFKEELIQKCFHPRRLIRYLEVYNYDIGDDEYQDEENKDFKNSLNEKSYPGIHIFIDHSNIRINGEKLLIHHDSLNKESKKSLLKKGCMPRLRIDIARI
jgi:hypothetical protein